MWLIPHWSWLTTLHYIYNVSCFYTRQFTFTEKIWVSHVIEGNARISAVLQVIRLMFCVKNDEVKIRQRSILTFSSLCPSWVWWSCLLAGPGTAGVQLLFSSAWRCSARHQETSFCPLASSSHPGAASSDGQTFHAAKYEDHMVNGQMASIMRWRNETAPFLYTFHSCSSFTDSTAFLSTKDI